MKNYRAKFNPKSKNVYAVSLVENPAMEGDFIQFSSDKELKFADIDKDKRRVMGLILEPNKLVYRNQGGQEFNVFFTAQDIEDVSYNFQKQKNQNNSTIGHSGSNIDGVSFVETWLVENPEKDKSTNFGFSYPKGSWMGVMQIDNEDVWLDYVKTGKVKGFSIDAFMQLEEVNLNKVDMSDNKEVSLNDKAAESLVEKIGMKIASIFDSKKQEVKLEESSTGEKVKETEKVELEKVVEVKFNDESLAKFLKDIEEMFSPLKDENVNLKKQVEEFETKFTKQEERLVELEKQPATNKVNKTAVQLNYSKMSNREKLEYNLRLNK